MKMKRLVSFALAAVLMGTLALPTGAVSTDQQLTQVTTRVKALLGIGNEYESFYGDLEDNGISNFWSLNWSGEGRSLSVEASLDGKVLSYTLDASAATTRPAIPGSSSLPTFPKISRAEARKTAEAFLNKVLDSQERAVFEDGTTLAGSNQHRFTGAIQLNGLSAPITFSITVRAEDNQVIRFRRSDLYEGYWQTIPSAAAKTPSGDAAQALKGTLGLRLEYVLEENSSQAVLRYLPDSTDSYYVDAVTGKLVNLTQLYEELGENNRKYSMDNGGGAPAAEASTAPSGGLSQAEQAGIAKLDGVRPKEELDKQIRTLSALGLSQYLLRSASYWVDRETDEVFARIQYVTGEEKISRRTVVVDARTGALQSMSGYVPYDEERTAALTEAQTLEKATAFLTAQWGEDFALTALYKQDRNLPAGYDTYTFAHKVNGYFFPANCFTVSVNVTDGSICGLDKAFDHEATFDAAEGLIQADAALEAWFNTYTTTLCYLAVPYKLNPEAAQEKALIDRGLQNGVKLQLAYCLERTETITGLDAKTGAPISPVQVDRSLSYSDLEDCWAKTQVEALAAYGIGYTGGTFQPDKQLTQLDLVALLASTQGYYYDPTQEESADALYRTAYEMGLLTAEQRKDDALLTRIETLRLLLDGAGYGSIAKLEGIFRCSFLDEADIPVDCYGYAAIAQGMGVVNGDSAGNFHPNNTATRLDAAVMLYQFMNR